MFGPRPCFRYTYGRSGLYWVMRTSRSMRAGGRAVLNEEKKKKFLYPGFPKMPTGTPCVGGWRLVVGDW